MFPLSNTSYRSRYAPRFGGYSLTVQLSREYARRARLEIDIDEPSIEALQTLMLLSQASFQLGKGKKTFMLLSKSVFATHMYSANHR
jgi:hypothetical protein